MSTHTPDPWFCHSCGRMYGYDSSLNAAAPDLLAALKALERQALQSPDLIKTEWGRESLAQARAAIAKAEGTS